MTGHETRGRRIPARRTGPGALAMRMSKRTCQIAITCKSARLPITPTSRPSTTTNRKGRMLSPLRKGFFLMGGTRRAPLGMNSTIGRNSILYCIRTVGACGTVHTRFNKAMATVSTGPNSAISRSSMLVGVK